MKKSRFGLFEMAVAMVYVLIMTSCKQDAGKISETNDKYYREQYRPQFHFSPEAGWMNDPNGLVYYEGEYHVFYQFYPDSNLWGPMHWGHAVSTDLVHWQHLPVALYPDSMGFIFSGSTVVDIKNTSGLGSIENPALVAIYTYHNPELERNGSNTFQSQGIAYSTDHGRTWTKYSGNPVLKSPGIRDFRDPKVIWHNKTGKWVMILAVHDRVHLYSSPNLINWTFESEFGKGTGAHGGVWECPDLFELKVEGSSISKWVMLVSINPGGPNSGSATQYFVGEFNGHSFTDETTGDHWVDWGRDNYAGVTWSNVPESDGRRIFLGWMSNWQYATVVPTYAWRSAMTVPRELSLKNENNNYLLLSNPVKELEILRDENPVVLPSQQISGLKVMQSDGIHIGQSEMVLDFKMGNPAVDSFGIILANDRKEKLVISYSPKAGHMVVDRTSAGPSGFSKEFSGSVEAPYRVEDQIQFRLFIDAASVELFVDSGKLVMTTLVFSSEALNKLKLFSTGGDILLEKAEFFNIKRIW
jgi:fructan beta-fructosidase